MFILITLLSIYIITVIVWLANRVLPFYVCPVCAGVSGTWLWMLIGMHVFQIPDSGFRILVAVMMGGSVVGIAYTLDKRLRENISPLLWKTLFIPFGFAAVWSILKELWFAAFVLVLGEAALAAYAARRFSKEKTKETAQRSRAEEIERKLEDCC